MSKRTESNPVQEKSYAFALQIVKLYQYLTKEKQEYVLAKQILRSGTSIGANIEEAIGGHSENDFAAKISISYKEARETLFWLRLMSDSGIITKEQKESIINDCETLIKILGSIQRTCKKKRNLQIIR